MKTLEKLRKELKIRKTDKRNFETVRVIVDIHCDGDVYVKTKNNTFRYIGKLGESDFSTIPCQYYLKIKKIAKKIC